MTNVSMKRMTATLIASLLTASVTGCGAASAAKTLLPQEEQAVTVAQNNEESQTAGTEASADEATLTQATVEGGVIDATDLFTNRDMEQEADLTSAQSIALSSGNDVTISEEGVYVLSGTVTDTTVIVDADTAKVQLVLDGVSITNEDAPAIYVKNADKVFVTTTEGSENVLATTGAFIADGDTNTDAVIFSKDDLTLNGLGTLVINSTDNGVSCKDDLKVTGGTYQIACVSDALEANDSIRVAGGTLSIETQKDALHAENDEDDTVGFIYISGGTLDINAADDGIHGTTYIQIDGGTMNINAGEGIEATYVQVNDGNIAINASDDGINASQKSSAIEPVLQIRGGNLSVTMAQGDTDALDSNGYIYISGGTVDINAQFAFDFERGAEMTGGTVYVNGEQVTEISESMMMGGPMGGRGQMNGDGGPMGGPGEMGGDGGPMGGGPGGHGGPGAQTVAISQT